MDLVVQGTSLHQVRMEKICDQLELHASAIQDICTRLHDVTNDLVEACHQSKVPDPS